MMLYKDTKVMVLSFDDDTNFFDIVIWVSNWYHFYS